MTAQPTTEQSTTPEASTEKPAPPKQITEESAINEPTPKQITKESTTSEATFKELETPKLATEEPTTSGETSDYIGDLTSTNQEGGIPWPLIVGIIVAILGVGILISLTIIVTVVACKKRSKSFNVTPISLQLGVTYRLQGMLLY